MNLEIAPNVWLALFAVIVAVPTIWFVKQQRIKSTAEDSGNAINQPVQDRTPRDYVC